MFRKFLLVIVVGCVLGGCSAVASQPEMDFYFQVAAPEHYHVWVQHLELEKSGVRHWRQAPGFVGCCWKGEGGPWGKGGRMDPFPDYIGIQWVSFAEEKIYQKLIIVEPEWIKRMGELAPYQTAQGERLAPRNVLILGLAPGGEIVIWIKRQVGNEIELDRLRANIIGNDTKEYGLLIDNYREENGDYLDRHGIPLSGW